MINRKYHFLQVLAVVIFLFCATRSAVAETIDIMIVYDSTAQSWVNSHGGMNAFAADAVARMNQAAQNSKIEVTFRLAHTASVSYTYSGDLGRDLDNLQAGSGNLSVVHQWRDTYNADLVALLVNTGSAYGTVGMGYSLSSYNGNPDWAFSVAAIQSVDISQTLTHEVGHNLGCDHSKFQRDSPGPNTDLNTYSAGWYFRGTDLIDYNTIMAYSSDGYGNDYTEAPLFSTPLTTYQGTIAGNSKDGDNARTIGQTKAAVAAYRSMIEFVTLTVNGSTTSGNISPSGNEDWYRFTISTSGTYTIETFPGTLSDTFMYLYGPESTTILLETDDDDGEGSAAKIVRSLSPGNYYVKIRSNNNTATGTYLISVKSSQTVTSPAGLTIPATDDDGSYEVSWESSSSAGNVTYVLEEASNSGFSIGVRTAYSGSSTSTPITDRSNWTTYFYRVKATLLGYTDSAWRYGLNGCKVTYKLVVMSPDSLTVPSSDGNGSYLVSWGASGTGNATYILEEATNSSFTIDLRTAYNGSATSAPITGRVGGVTYYYRVKATREGYTDSDWKNGTNGCQVTGNYLITFLQLFLAKLSQFMEFLN
jgi:hypothetical protein